MSIFSDYRNLKEVRDELKEISGIDKKPSGGISSFSQKVGYAISLGFKEKEVFLFGILQWVAIGLGYLLWVQMLDWIPESVWRSAAESEGGSIADWVLLAWSFVCVGLVAFPVGILSGCMGAVHFLNQQGKESTITLCLQLVLPQSWPLWSFHWIDGWVTVNRILDRLPKKNDRRSASDKALSEAIYYAWKLAISGVLPSILMGNGLIKSSKNSVMFVKDNFVEVAKLRAGYSSLCWIVGIGAYVGMILLLIAVDFTPDENELYGHIYTFYLWAAIPVLVAVGFVMLLLRPIYLLALCDLYSDHLLQIGEDLSLPENPKKGVSAFVSFGIIYLLVTIFSYFAMNFDW